MRRLGKVTGLPLLLVAATLLLLSGCGFHLRGAVSLPESLSSIAIEGTTEQTELGRSLYRSFKRGNVSIVPVEEASLRLQILRDEVLRRVLSVDASGKANEYELKHLLHYRLMDKQAVAVIAEQEIATVRAYKFDPNSLLAKGDEEQKLRRDIIRSSAQQLMRQLSATMRRQAAQQTEKDRTGQVNTEKTTSTPAVTK